MSSPSTKVVCDAGPLIHLDEVGSLDLLADFQSILVPEQVWREVDQHRPNVLESSNVGARRVSVAVPGHAPLQALIRALALDLGEQAALSLVISHPDAILLTDDAAARLAAEALEYRVHGTIGILLRALRRKQRTHDEVLSVLKHLPARSSLHIRPGLLREIIERVQSLPPAPEHSE
jgi:predicted nucleic acid-binding protein